MSPADVKKVCVQMVEGGVDFIKEDEILGNPKFCTFNERVELVSNAIKDAADNMGKEVFYAPCINADYPIFLDRVRKAHELGANAVHINIWGGLPVYKAIRDLDLDIALHFQKSGDKVMTSVKNPYSIKWAVITKLARMMGADFIHAGMWGGYLSDPKDEFTEVLGTLRNKSQFKATVASLSCGSHPGLVNTTVKNFGTELMMSAGGAIQGHPMGVKAGTMAMRQSMDACMKNIHVTEYMKTHPELKSSIDKWGYQDE
jgi:ribulose 1,5-bisphosphate carboxylase large subunit-like protein